MKILEGHANRINALAFTPDGSGLISAGDGGELYQWGLNSGEVTKCKIPKGVHYNDVAIHPEGEFFATACSDKFVRILSWESLRVVQKARGHKHAVGTVDYSANGSHFFSGSFTEASNAKTEVLSWPQPTPGTQRSISPSNRLNLDWYGTSELKSCPRYVAIAHGSFLLFWNPQNFSSTWEWNYLTQSPEKNVVNHMYVRSAIRSFDLDEERNFVAIGFGTKCEVFNVTTHDLHWRFGRHPAMICKVAWSNCGTYLATVSVDGTVRFREVTTGKELATFQWDIGEVHSFAFSPDGQTAAVAGEREIVIWDIDEYAGTV